MAADKQALWEDAAARVRQRIDSNIATLTDRFPHWANADTGVWTTTPDGDWTGGAWPGSLWVALKVTGDERYRAEARKWTARLAPRAARETAFKGFGFYCGAAIGDILEGDEDARALALKVAESLRDLYDPALGLIPLGSQAEEHAEVGSAYCSIDSLQASPLLFWAARITGDATFADVAAKHTTRALEVHTLEDGGIVQSSELDARDGKLIRRFTHKGYSDTSIWCRAQAWGVIYSTMAYAEDRSRADWLAAAQKTADWWLANVPADGVSFWDFSDPAIPNAERDTAGTAIVAVALLKLGELAATEADRHRYRAAAEHAIETMARDFLTPTSSADTRPPGILTGTCFNKRADARSHDYAPHAETVFGAFFNYLALQMLMGRIGILEV